MCGEFACSVAACAAGKARALRGRKLLRIANGKNARTVTAGKRSKQCQAASRRLADARRTLQPGASDAGRHASRRTRRPFGGKDFCGNELRTCDSRGEGKWLGDIARGKPNFGKRLRGLGLAHLRGEKSGWFASSSHRFAAHASERRR